MAPSAVDQRVGVVQICDTLEAGGLERVAVERREPPPARPVPLPSMRDARRRSPRGRTGGRRASDRRAAPHALRSGGDRAARCRAALPDIRIVHAHGTALFAAVAAATLAPEVAVVWHDHFGRFGIESRPTWLYRERGAAGPRHHRGHASTRRLVDPGPAQEARRGLVPAELRLALVDADLAAADSLAGRVSHRVPRESAAGEGPRERPPCHGEGRSACAGGAPSFVGASSDPRGAQRSRASRSLGMEASALPRDPPGRARHPGGFRRGRPGLVV